MKIKELIFFFLILLSKLRTNNRFEQKEQLIDFLGKILNKILDYSEENKLYEYAKNCIILSQTFFYKKSDDEKYYLIEKIKNNKWLTTYDFWFNFIEEMINKEIDKFLLSHHEMTKEDILNCSDKIDDKMKSKVSELLFSQLLPYINNMNEFKLSLKDIVNVTETFNSKYNYLNESQKESIFGLVTDNQKEVEKLREEYKKENATKIPNNQNTTPGNNSNTPYEKMINNININNINKTDNIINKNDKNKIETNNNSARNSNFALPKDNENNKTNSPEKSKNKSEGIFTTFVKNIISTKKEDKKENKPESKKDMPKITQKKEETENVSRKNNSISMTVNPESSNPFGVVLKKVPQKRDSNIV